MKIQKIAIAFAALFTVSIAQAQYFWYGSPSEMGPYVRAGIGPTFFQDSQLKDFAVSTFGGPSFNGPSAPVSYRVGYSFDGAFGWAFDRYVGVDFSSGYTWGRMDNVNSYSANGSAMGNVPFLGNVTLSLPVPHTNIVPYIGGGAGGADSIFDAHNFINNASGYYVDGSSSDVVFAYQAFAGVRFMLDPNVSVGFGYQFFATGNPSFGGPGASAEFEGVRTHSILFTLQANF